MWYDITRLQKLHESDDPSAFIVARDYIDIVDSFPFSSTLVAANASISASDLSGLSATTVDQLLESTMQTIVSTTVGYVSCFHSLFDEERVDHAFVGFSIRSQLCCYLPSYI